VKISENILSILAESRIDGNTLFLPLTQLDRKIYKAVNKCLENIGGKWNRKAKGHVFDHDPAEGLENLLLTGETEDMKKTFQFFPTPKTIAEQMCEMAELTANSYVLEPSAGEGHLARVIWECGVAHLYCIELNVGMRDHLENKEWNSLVGVNFLTFAQEKNEGKIRLSQNQFTHVIMNPPFSKQQDIEHIRAAFDVLKPGGVLVSVASVSWKWRDNKKSADFREWLNEHGAEIIDVPAGAFKASGTMIPTVIIKLRRDGELLIFAKDKPATEAQPELILSFAEKFRLTKAS